MLGDQCEQRGKNSTSRNRTIQIFAALHTRVPEGPVNKICAGDLAILFYGIHAAVLKPSVGTIQIDGTTVLLGSLGKQTELYMVDVRGSNQRTLQGATLHQCSKQAQLKPSTKRIASPLRLFQH